MPKVSVAEAARLFKASRPTITKALKSGALSGDKTVIDGSEFWQIDTAELARIYTQRSGNEQPATLQDSLQNEQKPAPSIDRVSGRDDNGLAALLQVKLDEAMAKLAVAEAVATEREKAIELAQALAAERKERIEELQRFLPKPEDGAEVVALKGEVSQLRELVSKQNPRGIWARLLGR